MSRIQLKVDVSFIMESAGYVEDNIATVDSIFKSEELETGFSRGS